MASTLATQLMILQIILYAAIALRLMIFNPQGRSHRPWVARIAFLLAASSAAAATHTAFAFHLHALPAVNPWHTIFIAIVAGGVFLARGNLAYFLPR